MLFAPAVSQNALALYTQQAQSVPPIGNALISYPMTGNALNSYSTVGNALIGEGSANGLAGAPDTPVSATTALIRALGLLRGGAWGDLNQNQPQAIRQAGQSRSGEQARGSGLGYGSSSVSQYR